MVRDAWEVLSFRSLPAGPRLQDLRRSRGYVQQLAGFQPGTVHAPAGIMDRANHYSKLFVWKVADHIRQEVFTLTSRPRFARDIRAQGQADDAANSICRNIAEGFACETHKDFARYLGYARRSLNELRDAVRGAMLKGYINARDVQPIERRAFHLRRGLSRFIAYLKATPTDNRMTAHGGRRRRKASSLPRRKPSRDRNSKQGPVDER